MARKVSREPVGWPPVVRVKVGLNHIQLRLVDQLVATGLHGLSRADVLERILDARLIELLSGKIVSVSQ